MKRIQFGERRPMPDADRKLYHFVACHHCGEASNVRRGTSTIGRILCEKCRNVVAGTVIAARRP